MLVRTYMWHDRSSVNRYYCLLLYVVVSMGRLCRLSLLWLVLFAGPVVIGLAACLEF